MRFYEIVFSGQCVPGAALDQVKSNLAKLFQADAQRIELLFSGRRLVLKNNLDAQAAEKYRAALARAGAVASIDEMAQDIEEIIMTAPAAAGDFGQKPMAVARRAEVVPRDAYMAAFVAVDAPDFAIAEVGADLQDERPAQRSAQLNLQQFSLAPAGSDMGQLRHEETVQVPDISHLKIIG
ncbi:hypothetical protein IFT98_05140 [Pseudomonas sp. CFBP 8770]|uniref:hypothetical protein n=1 Tax=unclassified Pseudomonas TaxID=196821 RepID=UPI0017857D11|nr:MULTISPECIES: hypothetical protein [unclassified Pseudomonas]MBD8473243.1 hypothetical protein [Pseudomonas sp. CFBP 8773]MBD8646370.1 hypothetical protein [Pseudomonas sp. CFBP 8770]